ncbi:MAG: hypothetical protein JWN38_1151 [Candidatus Saccharibacteria bacterium]|nr:hypothetical protein [Candidatus Saccharibacteria bacterium]
MSDFSPVLQTEFYTQQIEQLQLVSPTLAISPVLQNRMLRHGRTLEINEVSLIQGVSELEIERPTYVSFDSLPKDSTTVEPALSLNWPRILIPVQATVRIHPNFTAEMNAAGAEKKMNAAFWTGVLATEALNEGRGPELMQERQKLNSAKWQEYVVPAIGGFAVDETLGLTTGMGLKALAIGLPLQLAGVVAYARHRKNLRGTDSADFVLKKYAEQGRQLGESYPVLSQGYTLA